METHHITISEQQTNQNAAVNSQTLSGTLDTIQVSFATNIRIAKTSIQSLRWIIEQIRTSKYLQEKIAYLRSEPSLEKRQELKKELLPYFCTASFNGGNRRNKDFKSIRFVVIDIDHIQDRLDEIETKLRKDDEVFMSFLSPSGDGFKVIFALDREVSSEDEFRSIYQQLRQNMKDKYGVETDNTIDPARACFLSYDPDLYLNDHCRCITTAISAKPSSQQVGTKPFKELLSAKNTGNRTPTLASQIGTYIKRGIVKEEALELSLLWNQRNVPPLPEGKVTRHDQLYV